MPMRRQTTRLDTWFEPTDYAVEYGLLPDGRIGEIFITTTKAGSQLEAAARDAAIAISHALQRGAEVAELRASATRDGMGRPLSIVGHALDLVANDFAEHEAAQ